MTQSRIIVAVTAALLLTACNGPNSRYEDFGTRVNTSGFGHRYAQPDNVDELVVGPGDSINIQIANNPQLSGTQPVRIEGTVNMPFIDQVKVAGLTPTQIRDKLEILLAPYIRDVTVQVVPIDIQSKNVYVIAKNLDGDLVVGRVPVTGDMTLIDLIIDSNGGFPTLSDDCHVRVMRGDPLHPQVLDINVRDMLLNGYTAANIRMLPDDMVYFPPDFWGKLTILTRRTTRPIRELSNSVRGISTAVDLIEDGQLDSRRGYGGTNY